MEFGVCKAYSKRARERRVSCVIKRLSKSSQDEEFGMPICHFPSKRIMLFLLNCCRIRVEIIKKKKRIILLIFLKIYYT